MSSIKRTVASLICHPIIGHAVGFIYQNRIPSRRYVIDTSQSFISPKVKAMLFWKIYESAEIRFAERYLRHDLDVIELGSSLGVMTCHIRKRIKESCRLVTVEASPALADHVKLNLSINGLDYQVLVVNKAINYSALGSGTIYFEQGDSNLAGYINHRQTGKHQFEVSTTTLAQIIDEYKIDDYVLVSDIEGAELGIAIHEKEALKKCKQIIIELHDTISDGTMVDVKSMCNMFITEHGFHLLDHYGPVYVFERR